MRRLLVPFAAVLLAAVPLGLRTSASWAAPACFGLPATHAMQAGDPEYHGTAGNDVVVGSPGNDGIILDASGGTDLVCGGSGNDYLTVSGTGSKADGGTGQDQVFAYDGALARGGSGNDLAVLAFGVGSSAEGGSGNDANVGAFAGATADGGSGNDFVQGSDAAALYGGSGADIVIVTSGDPKVDCGSSYDLLGASLVTDVRRCEGDYTP